MRPSLAYADASALGKLFLAEPESAELRRFLAGNFRVVAASIARVEVHRALRRAGAPQEVIEEAKRFFLAIDLHRSGDEVLERAERLAPSALRTLDALHLATALDFRPLPDCFICYDTRLGAAARLHGLTVVSPGVEAVHEP